ncbi:MAG: acylphosphatase [Coxiella sp. (in: Bacteria)]|nr:MAG: acylphosphatase [Coxiella sp. (in: g-proteobacteria)]
MKTIHAIISGNVQNVFFRDSTKRLADSLAIGGWVRNNADGCVELVATGDTSALKTFCDWLHEGPPAARVDNVTQTKRELELFDSFDIT